MLSKILPTTLLLFASLTSLALAGESVHLVNCNDNTSRVYYYSTDGNYPPSDQAEVSSGGDIHWEGRAISAYFSDSGVTFTSNIQANAGNYAAYSYAGSGSNGYHNFNCYRDDEHTISGTGCRSIYYCFDS